MLTRAHEGDQPALAAAVDLQQFFIRNVFDLFPDVGIVEAVAPVRLQVLVVEQGQIAVQPARQMDAVGDGRDRHFPQRQLRPEVVEHFLRDVAMQAADGVAVGGGIERQDGHGEAFVAIVRIAPPERHQLLEIDADFGAVLGKVVVHEAGIEQIDAGRHRRVRGEDVARASGFQGLVEGQFLVAHEQADLLQRQKRGVAFVHVKDGGLEAHGLQARACRRCRARFPGGCAYRYRRRKESR